MPGLSYAIESNPAITRRCASASNRVDAVREATAIAQRSHLTAFVYIMPSHKLWATVDANGKAYPLPDIERLV